MLLPFESLLFALLPALLLLLLLLFVALVLSHSQ